MLAGALARSVKRAKLAVLGRALLLNNPLMIAEEYAILDNLTCGRLIAGVRGIGAEYHAMGINPAYSQERFAEAHDLIVRAWTEPGRSPMSASTISLYVNPWPRPYQSPHPPIWIPRRAPGSTIRWAAQMRYTYCQTLSPIAAVARFFQLYRDEADKAGYHRPISSPGRTPSTSPTPTRRRCARRAASRGADELVPENADRDAAAAGLYRPGLAGSVRAVKLTGKPQSIEEVIKAGVVIVGSPATVREKLAEYQDLAGFNTSLTKTQFGTLPNDMARANMTAIAEEILPHATGCRTTPAAWRRENRGRRGGQNRLPSSRDSTAPARFCPPLHAEHGGQRRFDIASVSATHTFAPLPTLRQCPRSHRLDARRGAELKVVGVAHGVGLGAPSIT